MSTQMQTSSETPTPAAEAQERRSFGVNLRGEDGASLRISLKHKKDGTATTQATFKPKKGGKAVRGATEQHPNVEVAKAAQAKLVAQAMKLGWTRKERSSGFQSKPDAFDASHLPAPGKTVSKK